MKRIALPALTAVCLAASLTACGSESSNDTSTSSAPETNTTSATDSGAPAAKGDPYDVTVSLFALEYLVTEIGGGHITVTNLTKPGSDPHSAELTAKQIAGLESSKAMFYLGGDFQPQVEKAVNGDAKDIAVDVADAADLATITSDEVELSHAGHDEHNHGDEGSATDPHFWLDPVRVAAVAQLVEDTLVERDPDNAAMYQANGEAVRAELTALDTEMAAALKTCKSDKLVTAHAAFGYLAEKYNMTQVGIAGLSPEDEPSTGELKELTEYVTDNKVGTIYYEETASDAVAKTLADETGVATGTLHPLGSKPEGVNDYPTGMKNNLAALQKGQECQ